MEDRISKQYDDEFKTLSQFSVCYKAENPNAEKDPDMSDVQDIMCRYDVNYFNIGETSNTEMREVRYQIESRDDDTEIAVKKIDGNPTAGIHELFVSAIALNPLKKLIPNFQYCFGALFVKETESINILYEDVGSDTMSDKLSSCSYDDFMSWIIQISLALEFAATYARFTHYNLHTDNIIIQKLSKEVKIPYLYNDIPIFVKAKTFAVIVNPDMAHVKHGHEHYGSFGYEDSGVMSNKCRPFYDLYKLIMSSLYILRESNTEVYAKVIGLMSFFGFQYKRDIEEILNETQDFVYSAEITQLETNSSVLHFIKFLWTKYGNCCMELQADEALDVITMKPKKVNGPQNCTFVLKTPEDIISWYRNLKKRSVDTGRTERLDAFVQLIESNINRIVQQEQAKLKTMEDLENEADLAAVETRSSALSELLRVFSDL